MDYSRHPVFAKTYGSWRAMLQRCYDKKFVMKGGSKIRTYGAALR